MTYWRGLRDWQQAGVWEKLHLMLLDKPGDVGKIDWSRAAVDSASIAAKRGGSTGPSPTNNGKPGTERHIMVDAKGVPLAVICTVANVPDSNALTDMTDAVKPIKKPKVIGRGRRKRPTKLHADKGHDFERCRRALRSRGIAPPIARLGVEGSKKLGKHRWVVECTLAWLSQLRRLVIRYERGLDIHRAFLHLGCALLCWNYLK
jgi:transposase